MSITKELNSLANPTKVTFLMGYFKTAEGEYGAGDVFLGITVPEVRKVARKYADLPLSEIAKLLHTNIHEYRSAALEILVFKYEHATKRGEVREQKKIVDFYLKNKKWVNNWDLVDGTARSILGEYLLDKPKTVLYTFARSKNIWHRRIAIIATYAFITKGKHTDTLNVAKILLNDSHDLMHKAVGWMLREVGNRDKETEVVFLNKYYKKMPRTMLRYAIEKFPEEERQKYLKSLI